MSNNKTVSVSVSLEKSQWKNFQCTQNPLGIGFDDSPLSLEETKFDDFSPSIRGKIITLRISCTRKDYCVVLKVRGKLKCPFINPTTVKPTSQYSGTVGNQSGKDNSGVIGGAIGGVIILLVAVVLIVLVMAIRRKR
ncbi:hypothetical protein AC249_AIPGENE23004 [Exaiptasia diaphana]|nr:hypothetical protein AC249_AIPGENE23004 [Exaiptasia diaphana]